VQTDAQTYEFPEFCLMAGGNINWLWQLKTLSRKKL